MKITSLPVQETFKLDSDPEGLASVTVRQANEGHNIERTNLFNETERIFDDALIGSVRLRTKYNQRELRRKEAYLTLVSIDGITDEDGKELFASGETAEGTSIRAVMSEPEFNRKWNMLPPAVAAEICRRVLDVNPTWDPNAGE